MFLKFISKEYRVTTKREGSKIQAMEMKFWGKKQEHRIRSNNVRLELRVDEKKWHSKEHFKMVWTCDATGRREDT